jgi:NADH-quinone oxidoreductase subunit G
VWLRLKLNDGDKVHLVQGDGQAVLPARLDTTLARNVVRVPAGHAHTSPLGPMFGPISVAKA